MKKLTILIILALVIISCGSTYQEEEIEYDNEIEYIVEGSGIVDIFLTNDWGNSIDFEGVLLDKGTPWLYSINKINRGKAFDITAWLDDAGGIVKVSVIYHGKLISTETNSGENVHAFAGVNIK